MVVGWEVFSPTAPATRKRLGLFATLPVHRVTAGKEPLTASRNANPVGETMACFVARPSMAAVVVILGSLEIPSMTAECTAAAKGTTEEEIVRRTG